MTVEQDLWKRIENDAAAHRKTDTLYAAIKLGLFDVVREKPMAVAQIAAAVGGNERRLKYLLDLLAGYDYLLREGELYQQNPDLLPLTDPERTDSVQRRLTYPTFWRGSWQLIDVAIKEDRSVRTFGGITDRSEEIVDSSHRSIGVTGLMHIQQVAPKVELPAGARILDLGGGYGDLCRPFLDRDENASAVLYEAPDTIPLAQRYLAEIGLEERIETRAGNFLTDELPSGFDLVILASVIELFDETTNAALMSRIVAGLNPGGAIMVRELAVAPDYSGPLSGLEFSLHIAVNTDAGRTYPAELIESLFTAAGCTHVQRLTEGERFNVVLGRIASS